MQTSPRFYRSRVWSYIQSNRVDKAIAYMEEVLTKDNQQRNTYLGYLYLQIKNEAKAIELLENGYKQVEVEGMNSTASVGIYYLYGEALIRVGQIEKGTEIMKKQIPVYNKMLRSKQTLDFPFIYYQSMVLYATLGNYEKAYDYLEKFEAANGWLFWDGMVSFAKIDTQIDFFREDSHFKASLERGEKQIEDIQKQIRPYLTATLPPKTD